MLPRVRHTLFSLAHAAKCAGAACQMGSGNYYAVAIKISDRHKTMLRD
jgi:hypothetical protein